MCDTSRCRTHSSHHQRGCDCGACGSDGYASSRNSSHRPASQAKSFSDVIQATFTR
jgi:hypothetical protein